MAERRILDLDTTIVRSNLSHELLDYATSLEPNRPYIPDEINKISIEIASLTAGFDPEKVDESSLNYKFGVSEALSNVTAYVDHHVDSIIFAEKAIEENGGDEMIELIGDNPGLSWGSMAKKSGQGLLEFGRKFVRLRRAELIDRTISAEKGKRGWELSPYAIDVYARRATRRAKNEMEGKIYSRQIIDR